MIEDITPAELKERLASGESLNILDVREQSEYDEDNLNGKLISLGNLQNSLDEIADWKDQEVIVHCRSGARSAAAKKYLESQGFTHVRNLLQGIQGFRQLV
jgi:rhodanese-related sulfurtransferase